MTAPPDTFLAKAIAELDVAATLLMDAQAAHNRATQAVQSALEQGVKQGIEALPKCHVPVTAHRAEHRAGRAPKIDSDPELQAFIRARINRLTFAEIADDVRDHFPAKRRVGKSTIWEWWKRQ